MLISANRPLNPSPRTRNGILTGRNPSEPVVSMDKLDSDGVSASVIDAISEHTNFISSNQLTPANLLDKLERVTVVNNDHLLIADTDTPTVRQIKLLQAEIKDAQVVVCPPEDVVENGASEWADYVVGYFLDKKLPFSAVDNIAKRIWKKFGIQQKPPPPQQRTKWVAKGNTSIVLSGIIGEGSVIDEMVIPNRVVSPPSSVGILGDSRPGKGKLDNPGKESSGMVIPGQSGPSFSGTADISGVGGSLLEKSPRISSPVVAQPQLLNHINPFSVLSSDVGEIQGVLEEQAVTEAGPLVQSNSSVGKVVAPIPDPPKAKGRARPKGAGTANKAGGDPPSKP
ncbi:hypothetical protein RHGRI_024490 [Rhododendron griersonianum]|uniref:Uncharacterized protein n=1 Tax=Rhododendron griersonianum TaxID=479676 RepID=A0AAV6J9I8_9ERIC|nr:hypothetical protein RHGRI_024490 [Rhododendron griersonianum]